MKLVVVILGLLGLACAPPRVAPPELPADLAVVPRGHQEVWRTADGRFLPRWLGAHRTIGLCFDAPVELDTSQWRVDFRFDGRSSGALTGSPVRSGTYLCFGQKPPPDLPSSANLEVCASVHDNYSDRRFELPCFDAVFDADNSAYREQSQGIGRLLRESSPRSDLLAALAELAREIEGAGYLALAVRTQLIAVHILLSSGDSEDKIAAMELLGSLPGWLEEPVAADLAWEAAYERAKLELGRGALQLAWAHLVRAEQMARSVASPKAISITAKKAEILTRQGAGRGPLLRLRESLEACAGWCDEKLLPDAHQQVAWLTLLDPDATRDDLRLAEESLAVATASQPQTRDTREQANLAINRAFLASRLGRSAVADLTEARQLLEPLEDDPRKRNLLGWADVVEGRDALLHGAEQRALDACARATAREDISRRLAAWAWSCMGRAHRRSGNLRAARQAFDAALLRHAVEPREHLGQDLYLAPFELADDHYRAAELAVQMQEPDRAWRILEALDRLRLDGSGCGEHPAIAARRQQLYEDLAILEEPHAPARRRQLEPVRRSLLAELEELHRAAVLPCLEAGTEPAMADLRAFPLPDEIVLLQRKDDGIQARRTAFRRRELTALLRELGDDDLDGLDWKSRTQRLAEAILPEDVARLGDVTIFALHGVLQHVPLAALPVATPTGERWLSELTTPVFRPSVAVVAGCTRKPDEEGDLLFVVDPSRNLPSGPELRNTYQQLFPDASILWGEAATREAVRGALTTASVLHLDAHGRYHPAFPQVSAIEMSDGPLSFVDLANLALPRRLINLSGCDTGSAIHTGDSGRYGLAGALAATCIDWVVASRAPLADRLARDFNSNFYSELQRGASVPEAFERSLADLRKDYVPAEWSSLVLVSATAGEVAGAKTLPRGLPEGE